MERLEDPPPQFGTEAEFKESWKFVEPREDNRLGGGGFGDVYRITSSVPTFPADTSFVVKLVNKIPDNDEDEYNY